MNSGDVHRHQAHPPLAQHALSSAHAAHWYGAGGVPPAPLATAPAAPTAPQRVKRQPPHQLPSGGGVTACSNNGSGAPLSPNALHNLPSAHANLPSAHSNLPSAHANLPSAHANLPTAHSNLPSAHANLPTAHSNAPPTHNKCPLTSSVRLPSNAAPASMHTSQQINHFRAGGVAGKPTDMSSSCGASSWRVNLSNMPWHHGAISRERTEQLLSSHPDGVFLIRESTNFPGDHTLCVRYRGHVEHYRIKRASPTTGGTEMLTIDEDEYFNNMTDLIDHYLKDADGLCTRLYRGLPKGPAPYGAPPATPPAFMPPPAPHHALQPPTQPPSQPAPAPPLRPPAQHGAYADQTDSAAGAVLDPKLFVKAGWVIKECDLEIRENIGKGEFGEVMLGILQRTQKVAVKILKDKEAAGKFLAEASLMTSLKDDNLVQLLGVVFTSAGSTCIVTEHMAQGSLLDYLRSRGRHYVTQRHQITLAYDACCGMEYLERKRVVHRDLAARNVLIAADGAAKVADFGLARPDAIRTDDPHAAKLPIKWTAPEALKYNRFSNKSDMWSFGILLWEIYSFGRVPYPRISLNEVVKAVEEGHRMDAPEGCPPESYELMRAAWEAEPALRPTFLQARQRLLRLRDATV